MQRYIGHNKTTVRNIGIIESRCRRERAKFIVCIDNTYLIERGEEAVGVLGTGQLRLEGFVGAHCFVFVLLSVRSYSMYYRIQPKSEKNNDVLAGPDMALLWSATLECEALLWACFWLWRVRRLFQRFAQALLGSFISAQPDDYSVHFPRYGGSSENIVFLRSN